MKDYILPVYSAFAEKHLLVTDLMGDTHERHFYYNREFVDSYLVMHVVRGMLFVEQDKKAFCLCPDDGILLDLRRPHLYYFDKDIPSEILWFHFHGKTADLLLRDLQQEGEMPLPFRCLSLPDELEQLAQAAQSGSSWEFTVSETIYRILMKILQQHQGREAPGDSFASAARQYILSHLSEPLSLDRLAAHFHMSRSFFCRKFRETFRQTTVAYIQQARVERAKKLLSLTRQSLSCVAAELGFYDQSYFTRVFARVTGCTPSRYRAQIRREKEARA